MNVTPPLAETDTIPPETATGFAAYNFAKSIIGKSAGVVSEYLGPFVSWTGRSVSYIADPNNTTPSSIVFGAICGVLIWKGISYAVAPWKTNWYQFQERFTSKVNIAPKLISFDDLIKKPLEKIDAAAKAVGAEAKAATAAANAADAQAKAAGVAASTADAQAKAAGVAASTADAQAKAAGVVASTADAQAKSAQKRANQALALQLTTPRVNPIRVSSANV